MQIEKLADEARKSLSEYCINECKAYCCRKGFLVLKSEEVDLVTGNQKESLIKQECLIEMENNQFSLEFNKTGCPSLRNNKCMIHGNKNRPKTCKEFPIFIEGKKIRLSPRCFGVNAGLLYPYVREFLKLGYKLV